jgi:hypothetical protein
MSSDLEAWLQPWGPGGNGAWVGSAPFNLPSVPPNAPTNIGVENNTLPDPTIVWTGQPNATWYQVIIVSQTKVVILNRWFVADAAACPGAKVNPPDYACAVGGLGLNLQPGTTYTIWMKAWGPAGFSVNGTASANGQYNTGTFIYQP